jgi:WD40 repeat protein
MLDKLMGGLNLFGSFSPEGQEFLIYSEGRVSLWEVETGRLITSLRCNGGFFQSSFSSDGKKVLTSCNGEKTARLWDARSGKAIVTFSNESNVAVSAFSPDKKTVVTTTLSGHVSVWDAVSGRLMKSWQGHADVIFYAGFAPDGKVLTTLSRDGNMRLWDVETGKLSGTLRVGRNANDVVFSPEGKLLVVIGEGGKHEIKVWNIAKELPVLNIAGHRKDIRNVEFSPDGSLLVSSSDDAVNVWDVINRTHLAKLDNASFPASFSNDARILATSGLKGTVILWDVATH